MWVRRDTIVCAKCKNNEQTTNNQIALPSLAYLCQSRCPTCIPSYITIQQMAVFRYSRSGITDIEK